MNVIWVSRKGGRENNEDAVGKLRKKGILCIAVADGLGGHNAGEVASHCVVKTVLNSFDSSPDFSHESVLKYINDAHNTLVQKSLTDPKYFKMSSTLTVLLIKGKRAMWANVGDSRLYRFEKDRILEVTEDHSLAFDDFMAGKIEYDDIRNSKKQNRLTNAVGSYIKDMNIYEPVFINGQSSFLLCTDGFWEYVDEDSMEQLKEKSVNPRDWLEKMIELREKNAPSDSDNYTAAVVFV